MRNRWPILALLCVLASLLVPGIASASAGSSAENRVWAFDLAEQVHVDGAAALTPGLHQGCELAEYDFASGSLLAAKGGGSIPGKPFRGPDAAKHAFGHLEKHSGLDPKVASNRLHKLKEGGGLGAADDVVIGKTGDVYNASTGERLGTLTDKALGRER